MLLPVASQAAEPQAPSPNPGLIALDLICVRPIGVVASAVGAVLFVPMALLASPQGLDGIKGALEVMVTSPGEFVFRRPLGEF